MGNDSNFIDKTSAHFFGEFPEELPYENAATPIALFFGWVVAHGLESDYIKSKFPTGIDLFRERTITPTKFFLEVCDGNLLKSDLNEEAGQFADYYYDSDERCIDLENSADSDLPTFYHLKDDWDTYDRYDGQVSSRFINWRNSIKTGSSPTELINYCHSTKELGFESCWVKPPEYVGGVIRFDFYTSNKRAVIVRSIKWSTEWCNPNLSDQKRLNTLKHQLLKYKSYLKDDEILELAINKIRNPHIQAQIEAMSKEIGFEIKYLKIEIPDY